VYGKKLAYAVYYGFPTNSNILLANLNSYIQPVTVTLLTKMTWSFIHPQRTHCNQSQSV